MSLLIIQNIIENILMMVVLSFIYPRIRL